MRQHLIFWVNELKFLEHTGCDGSDSHAPMAGGKKNEEVNNRIRRSSRLLFGFDLIFSMQICVTGTGR